MERLCEYCMESFTPKRVDMCYCSPSCRQMAYLKRKTSPDNINKNIAGLNYQTSDNDRIIQSQNTEDCKSSNSFDTQTKTILPASETDVTNAHENEAVNKSIANHTIKPSETSNKNQYIERESVFIKELTDLANERDYVNDLSLLNYEGSEAAAWVNVRYRCLVECLLTFSEMKQLELDDLKEVCNAFTDLLNSRYYKYLPVRYPYTMEIEQLRNNIKQICINSEEEQVMNFKLREETRKKMIVTRWELAHYAPKKSFSQLNFKEDKK